MKNVGDVRRSEELKELYALNHKAHQIAVSFDIHDIRAERANSRSVPVPVPPHRSFSIFSIQRPIVSDRYFERREREREKARAQRQGSRESRIRKNRVK